MDKWRGIDYKMYSIQSQDLKRTERMEKSLRVSESLVLGSQGTQRLDDLELCNSVI